METKLTIVPRFSIVTDGLKLVAGLVRISMYNHAIYLWTTVVVNNLGGACFWLLVARLYPPREVGLASAALSALSLLGMVSQMGMGLGLVRFIPSAKEKTSILLQTGLLAAATTSAIAAGLFLLGLNLWAPELLFLRQSSLVALLFLAFTVASAVTGIQDYALLGLRRARYIAGKAFLSSSVRVALPIGLVAFAAIGIVASMGLSLFFGVVLGFWLLRRSQTGYHPLLPFQREALWLLFPFSAGNYVADVFMALPGLVLPITVMNVLGPEKGAFFYVAWFSGNLLFSIPIYLALSLLTEGSYKEEDLKNLTKKALLAALLLILVGITTVFIIGERLLLLFGVEYAQEGMGVLRLVALAALPGTAVYVFIGVERVRKHIASVVGISALVSSVTLAASYLLLPQIGPAGAGVALLTGQGLGACIAVPGLLLSWRRQPKPSAV